MAESGDQSERRADQAGGRPRGRLLGRHFVRFDEKGRLVVPAQHRQRYESGCVLSTKPGHIAIYEPEEWDRFIDELAQARRAGRVRREVFNHVTTNAAEVKVDKSSGRMLIPAWMRAEVGLGDEVMFGGAHEYLGVYPGDHGASADPDVARAAAAEVEALGL